MDTAQYVNKELKRCVWNHALQWTTFLNTEQITTSKVFFVNVKEARLKGRNVLSHFALINL